MCGPTGRKRSKTWRASKSPMSSADKYASFLCARLRSAVRVDSCEALPLLSLRATHLLGFSRQCMLHSCVSHVFSLLFVSPSHLATLLQLGMTGGTFIPSPFVPDGPNSMPILIDANPVAPACTGTEASPFEMPGTAFAALASCWLLCD